MCNMAKTGQPFTKKHFLFFSWDYSSTIIFHWPFSQMWLCDQCLPRVMSHTWATTFRLDLSKLSTHDPSCIFSFHSLIKKRAQRSCKLCWEWRSTRGAELGHFCFWLGWSKRTRLTPPPEAINTSYKIFEARFSRHWTSGNEEQWPQKHNKQGEPYNCLERVARTWLRGWGPRQGPADHLNWEARDGSAGTPRQLEFTGEN